MASEESSQSAQPQPVSATASSQDGRLWSGFHRKTVHERTRQLGLVYPDVDVDCYKAGGLSLSQADLMVENCVGMVSLPVGLGLHFLIDNERFSIPMAVEEPSIIAAASASAQFIGKHCGFTCETSGSTMIGQVHLVDFANAAAAQKAVENIRSRHDDIMREANTFCESMVQRGGGLRKLHVRFLDDGAPLVIVHLLIDVCDAMGANVVNTVCEGISPMLQELSGAHSLLKILSNLCVYRKSSARFRIPIDKMAYRGYDGEAVAKRMVQCFDCASRDIFRAVTLNKGIMNGVDAVALACGQDWRAIESGNHAFATLEEGADGLPNQGRYKPLAKFTIVDDPAQGRCLQGQITLALAVGVKGGALRTNPFYSQSLHILGNPSSAKLASIMCCVGLANTFAANRAIATEGINRGHMALHAKNICIAAGVPGELVTEVVNFMKATKKFDRATALGYMRAHQLFKVLRVQSPVLRPPSISPSTLFVAWSGQNGQPDLSLHVAFEGLTAQPIHLSITEGSEKTNEKASPTEAAILGDLLGGSGVKWTISLLHMINDLDFRMSKFFAASSQRSAQEPATELKLIATLMHRIAQRCLWACPKQSGDFLSLLLENGGEKSVQSLLQQSGIEQGDSNVLVVGLPVVFELWRIFHHRLDQYVSHSPVLLQAVKEHNSRVMRSTLAVGRWWYENKRGFAAASSSHGAGDSDSASETKRQLKAVLVDMKPRMHVSLVVLIDLMLVPSELVQREHISLIESAGSLLEAEGVLSHDMAKAARDWDSGHPNVTVWWLKQHNHVVNDTHLKQFLAAATPILDELKSAARQNVLSQRIPGVDTSEY